LFDRTDRLWHRVALNPLSRKQTQWTESVLWSFSGMSSDDGVDPEAALIADKSGNL
jgi:hypothetical protein